MLSYKRSPQRKEYEKRWRQRNRLSINRQVREWRHRNPEKCKAYTTKYNATHKQELAERRLKRAEIQTVYAHFAFIFHPRDTNHANAYAGMPFYDAWNPEKGGSFKAAELWIINNLGKRQEGTSLHVIDHAIGFVPNNLEWTHPRKQNREQMIKIIARQRNEIKKLTALLQEHRENHGN